MEARKAAVASMTTTIARMTITVFRRMAIACFAAKGNAELYAWRVYAWAEGQSCAAAEYGVRYIPCGGLI